MIVSGPNQSIEINPHPRQTFEPPNTYRGLENEKRQKGISSLVGRCCQTFWERRYPALETCVSRGGLSSQFFRRPGCTAKLLVFLSLVDFIYASDWQELTENVRGL